MYNNYTHLATFVYFLTHFLCVFINNSFVNDYGTETYLQVLIKDPVYEFIYSEITVKLVLFLGN